MTEIEGQKEEKNSEPENIKVRVENLNNGKNMVAPDFRRDKAGRFIKGCNPNPIGKPRRPHKTSKQKLDLACEKLARETGMSFEEATVRMAYEQAKDGNTSLWQKIMDKRIANMNEIEVTSRPVTMIPRLLDKSGAEIDLRLSGDKTPAQIPEIVPEEGLDHGS